VVARLGLDTLAKIPISEYLKTKLPELPIEIDFTLPGYKVLKEHTGTHSHMGFIAEAQALKDATMAKNIYQNLQKGTLLMHINGAYHSNNYEGIYWYLKKYNPEIKITTISTVEQEDISNLAKESLSLADFIIVTPGSMTKTH